MTSGYHGSKISGSRHSLLTEEVICIVDGCKESAGYCFVPECNGAQYSSFFLVFAFVCFYFATFAGPRFVKIQKFFYPAA